MDPRGTREGPARDLRPVSSTVLGPSFGSANLCRAGPKFWPESGPCFTLSENHFCDFGASRRVTIASVFFLATCYWVNALACKAGGDNLTVEAPRQFSCDFQAPKRRPANGLRRGKHRPSRVPESSQSKMKLENVFSSESYTVHKIRSGSFAKFCTQLV